MNISIVSGWLPVVMVCVTVAVLLVALDWRTGGWRRQLLIGVPMAIVVTGVAVLVLEVGSLVPSDFPWTAFVGGFAFVLAVCAVVVGWHGAGGARRTAGVVAAVLTLVVAAGAVNEQSDSYPTLGRLVSFDPENAVDTPQLAQMRAQVAATGKLPDQGVVFTVTIPPTVSHFATRPAYVYLPPAWFARVRPSLPTLVLLPGEPGSASDWSSSGDADNTADAFAKAHHGVAPIIVMPDPNGVNTVDSECVNSKFGNAETYVSVDVPAYARSRLAASTAPGSLAIGGLSAGGTCSVMLALRHPKVYPTFASYSGFASPQYQNATLAVTIDTLFGGSESDFAAHDPAQILRTGTFDGLAGWFEVGDEDTDPLEAAQNLQPEALKAGIATCLVVEPGGHDFDLWSQALEDSFPWLCWRLGLTPEPAHEPATCESP
ncbi:MAG: alpha/beta hydrolase [Acidimicrobiales bacterium]